MEPGERIEIYPSRAKLVLLLVGAVAFVVIGGWFVVDPAGVGGKEGWAPGPTRGLGIAAVLFGGAGAAFMVKGFLSPVPAIVIDEEGIIDRTTAVSVGRVRWEEIDTVDIVDLMGTRSLRIFPRDPAAILSRARGS